MDTLTIKTSVLDYLDEIINGGVSIRIAITIYDFTFNALYWICPNGNRLLEIEPNFLNLFETGLEDSKGLSFYEELCDDIESILPEHKEIFESYNINI